LAVAVAEWRRYVRRAGPSPMHARGVSIGGAVKNESSGFLAAVRRRELAVARWLWPAIGDREAAERRRVDGQRAALLGLFLQFVPFLAESSYEQGFAYSLLLEPRTIAFLALFAFIYADGHRRWQAMALGLAAVVADMLLLSRFGWDYGLFGLVVYAYLVRCFVVGLRANLAIRRLATEPSSTRTDG